MRKKLALEKRLWMMHWLQIWIMLSLWQWTRSTRGIRTLKTQTKNCCRKWYKASMVQWVTLSNFENALGTSTTQISIQRIIVKVRRKHGWWWVILLKLLLWFIILEWYKNYIWQVVSSQVVRFLSYYIRVDRESSF